MADDDQFREIPDSVYFPVHTGARLPAKARGPSFASSEVNTSAARGFCKSQKSASLTL